MGDTLFARLGRSVAMAGCLPRKELLETWEVARRVRRRLRGGRVVDLASGHGLLAFVLLLLDPSSPQALAVDRRIPPSAAKLLKALASTWPEIAARVQLHEGRVEDVALTVSDVVVAAHACGDLTDQILALAIAARARVAVLPCCTPIDRMSPTGLEGWLGPTLAVDIARAHRLVNAGYAVHTQSIPEAITPRNRLLVAWPRLPEHGIGPVGAPVSGPEAPDTWRHGSPPAPSSPAEGRRNPTDHECP